MSQTYERSGELPTEAVLSLLSALGEVSLRSLPTQVRNRRLAATGGLLQQGVVATGSNRICDSNRGPQQGIVAGDCNRGLQRGPAAAGTCIRELHQGDCNSGPQHGSGLGGGRGECNGYL